jgi:hypothetical protein
MTRVSKPFLLKVKEEVTTNLTSVFNRRNKKGAQNVDVEGSGQCGVANGFLVFAIADVGVDADRRVYVGLPS